MQNQIDEFEDLMLDYLQGNIVPEDMQKLMLLLKNKECQKKYHEMSQAYGLAAIPWFERRREANFEQLRDKLNFRSSQKHILKRRIQLWGTAAIWALMIGCSIILFYLQKDSAASVVPASYCKIEVPSGATSKLILPDSTVVFINAKSVIKYDASFLGKAQREVFLSGEACFRVAKDVAKPFVVHAGELDVKVTGTTFNVTAYAEEPDIKVSLIEGSVQVSDVKNQLFLSPDEQAVYDKQKKDLFVRKVDATSQMAWVTGQLVFVNEPLRDILKRIEKKYNVTIHIQSHTVDTEYFSGSINADLTLDEILAYIDVDNKFVWKKKGNIVMIADK